MTRFESRTEMKDGKWPIEMARKESAFELVWFWGLIATLYLVSLGLFLAFLSVIFVPYSSKYLTIFDIMGMVGTDLLPACCYATIGVIGLKFLPSRRFWTLGLSAILVETALAIYAFANPATLPMFTYWLL